MGPPHQRPCLGAPTWRLFSRASREHSALLAASPKLRIKYALLGTPFIRCGVVTTRAYLGESQDAIRRFGCWSSEWAFTHYLFHWSAIPLRSWRINQPHPPHATTTTQLTSQPHLQQCHRRPRRTTHNRHAPRHAITCLGLLSR